MITARLTGFFFLALFLSYGYLAQDIQLDFWASEEIFDARTFPTVIAVAGTLASLLLIAFPTQTPLPPLKGRLLRPLLLIGLMLAYSFILEPLGFIVSTLAFLLAGFMILGIADGAAPTRANLKDGRSGLLTSRWLIAPLVAVGVSAFFYLLMGWLGIHLEPGILRVLDD